MAKGKFHGMGGMPNMNSMIKQAQKMQAEMQKKQEDIENSSSGGGAVTVTMSGKRLLTAVNIKPEACDPDDIEMLQDLIIAAVNDAVTKVDELSAQELEKVTGGINIPGLF